MPMTGSSQLWGGCVTLLTYSSDKTKIVRHGSGLTSTGMRGPGTQLGLERRSSSLQPRYNLATPSRPKTARRAPPSRVIGVIGADSSISDPRLMGRFFIDPWSPPLFFLDIGPAIPPTAHSDLPEVANFWERRTNKLPNFQTSHEAAPSRHHRPVVTKETKE